MKNTWNMSRSRAVAVLAVVACVLPAGVRGQAAQEAPPAEPQVTFGAAVEQVLVDAVVVDKKTGEPVGGLTRDDFIVSEEGDRQSVSSFQAVELAEPAADAAPPHKPPVSTNDSPEARTARTFVLIFDDVHLTPFQAQRARPAVVEFLKHGVREGDRVMIVATGGGAWWSARMLAGRDELLKVVGRLDGRLIPDTSPERMTDYEAMRIHTFSDPVVEERVRRRFESRGVAPRVGAGSEGFGGMGDPLVRGRAADIYFQAVARNRLTLDTMERVMKSLEPVRGRKAMVLVSQGFIYDPNLDEFRRVVQVARRSNVAVYFLDTRGLGGLPDFFSAEFGPAIDQRDIGAAFSETFEATAGSEALAADTGGFTVSNTNDLNKGVRRIAAESQIYYLLGYTSTNTKRDGRFRKIDVKLKEGRGLTVRARKGYFAPFDGDKPPDKTKAPYDPVLQAALDSPFDRHDIPMRATALVNDESLLGKANSVVAADVDVRRVEFEQKDGRFNGTLDFMMVVAHRDSGEYFRYDQQIAMRLLPETYERLGRTWYTLARSFELPAGGYQAKIVVRDPTSGRVGTVTHEFDVPDLKQWRVSSLLITDVLQPHPADQPDVHPRPALVVRREFPAGAMLYCSYEVYGAAKDPETGMPRVLAGYEIRKRDGSLTVASVEPTAIEPTSLGHLSRLTGASLGEAPPGEYEIVVRVQDELNGNSLEVREPFTIVPLEPALAQAQPPPAS